MPAPVFRKPKVRSGSVGHNASVCFMAVTNNHELWQLRRGVHNAVAPGTREQSPINGTPPTIIRTPPI